MMLSLFVRNQERVFRSPVVMGIVNCTPDSFFAGSRANYRDEVLKLAGEHVLGGAAILDLGAQSTRPNATQVSPEEEIERLAMPLQWIKEAFPSVLISVDTFSAQVAEYAIDNGVDIVNDISAGSFDPDILEVVAKRNTPYIAMFLEGTLATMHHKQKYQDVTQSTIDYFTSKSQLFEAKGIHQVIIDPGFGFSKEMSDNYQLLDELERLKILRKPIVVGVSRKRMVWQSLGSSPEEALNGTTVLNTIALLNGANILRVHDTRSASEAIKLVETLVSNR